MTALDEAIEELRERRADLMAEVAHLEHQITEATAELRGLERARDLFAPDAEPEKARHDVQGPVMRLFAEGSVWFENEIFEAVNRLPREADIPAASIHKFLVRAVRTGKLVCNKDGVYSLPAPVQTQAAAE